MIVVKAEEESTPVVAHKRHKKHEYALDNIPEGTPTEQIHYRLEGEALVCPNCEETMTEIGTEVVRTLEIIPVRTVVKEHIYHTYACQKCSKEGTETPVVKAPKEQNIANIIKYLWFRGGERRMIWVVAGVQFTPLWMR